MDNAKNNILKLKKFFKSLPEELKRKFIEDFITNRDERRKLKKIKYVDDKIDIMLSDFNLRKKLSESAYQITKSQVDLELNEATYDDIIAAITNENCIYYTIFFFRWCYLNDEDGNCHDDIYFDKFIESDLFNHIIKKNVTDMDIKNALDDNITLNSKDKMQPKIFENYEQNEVNKMKLIGRIERISTWYNFFPEYEFIGEEIRQIPNSRRISEYPDIGGINLAYSKRYGVPVQFLERIQTDLREDDYINNIYVIEINNDDIVENENPIYQFKVDLEKLVESERKLEDIIKNFNDENIFKIVSCEIESQAELTDEKIYLSDTNLIENELVLLKWNNNDEIIYIGPFPVFCRQYDKKYYIETNVVENNFLLRYYTSSQIKSLVFEKESKYNHTTYYTNCAYVDNNAGLLDVITDEYLLKTVTENDISLDLANNDPSAFVKMCETSPLWTSDSSEVVENRIARIESIVKKTDEFQEEQKKLFNLLQQRYSDISDEMITDSEQYKELKLKYTDERKQNDRNQEEIQRLTKREQELEKKIADYENNISDSSKFATEDEREQYESKIEVLENELELLKEKEEINTAINELKAIYNQRIADINDLETREKTVQTKVSQAIDAGVNGYADIAFEPYLASKMMEAAAEWDTKSEKDLYEKGKEKTEKIFNSSSFPFEGDKLIDYIVNYVQSKRNYSRNDILNIYINIVQNFITVFSGEPGTGKTSMCNIISESMGLNKFGIGINRFVPVSVERGWSSKRDLIGYFNPLTKKYDKSNKKIYDALRMLDFEKNESLYPYIIMLDEANLSPIEHYWSDFMKLTDRSADDAMYINIGVEEELYVPETLRFLATINTDQTTESLSPRFIDRACIIKLPNVAPKQNIAKFDAVAQPITWKNMKEVFSQDSELVPTTKKTLEEIYKLFRDYRMNVSPRIQLSIEKYIKSAQKIMSDESEAGVLAREKALDYAIVQKLLPKINGYYSTYEGFFTTLKRICDENNLKMTQSAIEVIENDQNRNMGYCQYLI